MYVGLARAGLVAVPVNFRLVATEVEYIATHCEARALHRAGRSRGSRRADPRPARDRRRRLHPFRQRARTRRVAARTRRDRRAASGDAPDVDGAPTDTWALMYTSGTTGRPKGAIRNHAGSALISLVSALDMGFARDHTALLVMPMCHANSLYFAFTFTYLRRRRCVIDDRKELRPRAPAAHALRAARDVHVARADALHHDARRCPTR